MQLLSQSEKKSLGLAGYFHLFVSLECVSKQMEIQRIHPIVGCMMSARLGARQWNPRIKEAYAHPWGHLQSLRWYCHSKRCVQHIHYFIKNIQGSDIGSKKVPGEFSLSVGRGKFCVHLMKHDTFLKGF